MLLCDCNIFLSFPNLFFLFYGTLQKGLFLTNSEKGKEGE